MNWSKAELKKAIEEARVGIEMTAQIVMAIKEFEHHANVNKKFIDKMKEYGCYAYIQKDSHSTTLFISKCESFGATKAEFRVYVSHVMTKSGLTWERIKTEVERHAFDQHLKNAEERLALIDKETAEAQELLAIIKSKAFKCFDFYKSKNEIEDAIRIAKS